MKVLSILVITFTLVTFCNTNTDLDPKKKERKNKIDGVQRASFYYNLFFLVNEQQKTSQNSNSVSFDSRDLQEVSLSSSADQKKEVCNSLASEYSIPSDILERLMEISENPKEFPESYTKAMQDLPHIALNTDSSNKTKPISTRANGWICACNNGASGYVGTQFWPAAWLCAWNGINNNGCWLVVF